MNKTKLKNIGKRCLAAGILISFVVSYRVMRPNSNLTEEEAKEVASFHEVSNWGLSFPVEGQQPVGNVSAEELAKYNAFYVGAPDEKTIYLTFDAGYENSWTDEILDTLKKEKVKATFFLVGTYIEANPEMVKRMVKEGHLVANHTMDHPDMSAVGEENAFKLELENVEKAYKKVTGETMKKVYRPPQGKFSLSNLEMAKKLGYTTVFWSLAYVDWYENQQPTRENALAKLMPRTHNGAIILLHSTSKTNAQVLEELITKWKEEGYQFGSLEDLGK